MRSTLFIAFFFLSVSILAPHSHAGTLSGVVLVEQGEKSTPLTNEGVRLKIFKSQKEVSGAETRTNQQGRYVFPNLDTSSAFEYQVVVDMDGVPFRSNAIRFSDQKKIEAKPLKVKAVTGDTSALRARKITMIETGQNNVMKISESILIRNTGELTYDGRKNDATPLHIGLKPGGFNLQFIRGLAPMLTKIEEEEHRLRLTNPISPGIENELQIEYAYLYEYKQRSVDFGLSHSFPIESYTVVLTEGGVSLESAMLNAQGEQQIQGKSVQMYRGNGIKKGESVKYTIKGLTLPKDLAYSLLYIGLGLTLCFGLFMMWKGHRGGIAAQENNEQLERNCVDQLEKLERDFRTAQIDQEHYELEKERLLEILYEIRHPKSSNAA